MRLTILMTLILTAPIHAQTFDPNKDLLKQYIEQQPQRRAEQQQRRTNKLIREQNDMMRREASRDARERIKGKKLHEQDPYDAACAYAPETC
jgi:hypothetical protein